MTVMAQRLEEELSRFPTPLLDRQCSESHLAKLVGCIDTESMEMMAPDLELTPVEVNDIQISWPRQPSKQRLIMFNTWIQKKSSRATYR